MKLQLTDLTHIYVNPEWQDGGYSIAVHVKTFEAKKEAEEYIEDVKHLPFSIGAYWRGRYTNTQGPPTGYKVRLEYYASEDNFMDKLKEVLNQLPYAVTIQGPIVYPKTLIKDIIK